MDKKYTWVSNIITISESNTSEHWTIKSKRHKSQQFFIKLAYQQRTHNEVSLPCKIKMTRLATRLLDFDNLVSSLKWIRDQLADCIIPNLPKGRADGDPRIEWEYYQEKHPIPAVKIEIYQ